MDEKSAELELVPPERRSEVENGTLYKGTRIPVTKANGEVRYIAACYIVPAYFVTLYQGSNKKIVEIRCEGPIRLEQIAEKAYEVFPSSEWLICAGDENQAYFEFTDYKQLIPFTKTSRFYAFEYIFIRLEPVTHVVINDQMANCDECGQAIHGHRYRCTQCPDFDICQECEAKSLHLEHAMLRIVNRKLTEIPKYITDNAPRNLFEKS